eukprot:TRINITY_DN12091_c0_g1_i1.p1 TRINITY_DN12091_c0_g1~~TRINITY_DN12091_c0_g1_i1.p1  ORF type:complete len:359 (+),score=66.36 TRINITY_DN12091_c0_g1_i1:82-1158(+)
MALQPGQLQVGAQPRASCAGPSLAGQVVPPESQADPGDGSINAVSMLQEYIQSCSDFAPHSRILTWNFEQQLQEDSLLHFRATVSFVFGQVPHHFSGNWQSSKKKAQRDAAERVRRYLAKRTDTARPEGVPPQPPKPKKPVLPEPVYEELRQLQGRSEKAGRSDFLEWEIEERPSEDASAGRLEFRLVVMFHMHGLPHHFAGGWCSSSESAMADGVSRVLWYFGLEKGFTSHIDHANQVAEGPLPAQLQGAQLPNASRSVDPGPVAAVVEEKTVLMQVQNILQKTFAKDTPAGEKVWVWSYEPDDTDPQLFRALAEVPALGRTFYGDWCKGKKLAQRNACLVVKAFLEQAQKRVLAAS